MNEHCVYCRLYDDCNRKYYVTCVCDKYSDSRTTKNYPDSYSSNYTYTDEDICEL